MSGQEISRNLIETKFALQGLEESGFIVIISIIFNSEWDKSSHRVICDRGRTLIWNKISVGNYE